LFEVSTSFIYKALIRRCTTGETGVCTGQVAKKLVGYHEALLEQKPLHTGIMKLQRWLFKTFSVSSSIGGFWKMLNKLGLNFKNMPCCRTDVPDVR
jgi:transposase